MPSHCRLAVAAAALALAAFPAVALGAPEHTAAGTTTYPDSVGEDALAPDITSTTVSNDDSGNTVFQIAIANRPALTQDMAVIVVLDTDGNSATGDVDSVVPGSDYLIQLVPGSVDLFKWNGSDYAGSPAPSLTFAYASTGATIRVNTSELGRTKQLRFVVIAISGITFDAQGGAVLDSARRDSSPDPGHGAFTYDVNLHVTLAVTAFTTSPKPVRAGRAFSVGLAATQSDTNAGVESGTVACRASVAGKPLPVRARRLANGVAVCVWAIPKSAKGKRVQGSIALTAAGATASRSFSLRVG